MKIVLTNQEKEEIFYNALCNAEGMGYMNGYGVQMTYEPAEYDEAKRLLNQENKFICYEDFLMKILKIGGSLTYKDEEGGGDMDSTITLEDVYDRMDNVPLHNISNIMEENDDVVDADAVLQTIFWNEIIFG